MSSTPPTAESRPGELARAVLALAVTTLKVSATVLLVLVALLGGPTCDLFTLILGPTSDLVPVMAKAAAVLFLAHPLLHRLTYPMSTPTPGAAPVAVLAALVNFSSGVAVVAGPLLVLDALRSVGPVDPSMTAFAVGLVVVGFLLAVLGSNQAARHRSLPIAAWSAVVAIGLGFLPAWPVTPSTSLPIAGVAFMVLLVAYNGLWSGLTERLGRLGHRGATLLMTRGEGMAVGFCCGMGPKWLPLTVQGVRIDLGAVAIVAAIATIVGSHLIAARLSRADRLVLKHEAPAPLLPHLRLGASAASVADALAKLLFSLTDEQRAAMPMRVAVALAAAFTRPHRQSEDLPQGFHDRLRVLCDELTRCAGVRAIEHLHVTPEDELVVAVELDRDATPAQLREAAIWLAHHLGNAVDPTSDRPVVRVVLTVVVDLRHRSRLSPAIVVGRPAIVDLSLENEDLRARVAAVAAVLSHWWSIELNTLSVVVRSHRGSGGNRRVAPSKVQSAVDATPGAAALAGESRIVQAHETTRLILPTTSEDPEAHQRLAEACADFAVDWLFVVLDFERTTAASTVDA